jgi:hypothetical protein
VKLLPTDKKKYRKINKKDFKNKKKKLPKKLKRKSLKHKKPPYKTKIKRKKLNNKSLTRPNIIKTDQK